MSEGDREGGRKERKKDERKGNGRMLKSTKKKEVETITGKKSENPVLTSSSFPMPLPATAAMHSKTASMGSLSSSRSIGSPINGLMAFQ